jgi:hypothetical protein
MRATGWLRRHGVHADALTIGFAGDAQRRAEMCEFGSVAITMRASLLLLSTLLPAHASGANLTTLFNFPGGAGGTNPLGAPLFDAAGAIYGTTSLGGTGCAPVGCGTVFKLTPPAATGGEWRESVLYSFRGDYLCGIMVCKDGNGPAGDLISDASGTLFGTTVQGGNDHAGTVFALSPPTRTGGKWTETVLYSFTGNPTGDGGTPGPSLVFDQVGALYGVTSSAVFQLQPPNQSPPSWTLNVLANFSGAGPVGGVQFGKGNVLYGALSAGGGSVNGAVFTLTPPSTQGGVWQEGIIRMFPPNFTGGSNPAGGVILDRAGSVFGTTSRGGTDNDGVVFELKPPPNHGRAWSEQVLHSFTPPPDGRFPGAPLTLGPTGVLYGVTSTGGTLSQFGTVFELLPPSRTVARWSEKVLWSFEGAKPAASDPNAPVILDASKTIYGFTAQGGAHCQCGTLFALKP